VLVPSLCTRMRRSERKCPFTIPSRLKNLFHSDSDQDPSLPSNMQQVCDQPNIYLIKNFLNEGDIQHFDKICTLYSMKFASSFTEDEYNCEVLNDYRTSTFIHLSKSQDAIIRRIEERAANLIGISSQNIEPLQIVSYRDGQKFDTHHDAGTYNEDDGEVELVSPRRYATLFVYLNTLPSGQGHTEFPAASPVLSVTPQKGDGVLFCNILPDGQADPLTIHRACPVDKGYMKFGVNIWMSEANHQPLALVKSKTLVDKGCGGGGKSKSKEKGKEKKKMTSNSNCDSNSLKRKSVFTSACELNERTLAASTSAAFSSGKGKGKGKGKKTGKEKEETVVVKPKAKKAKTTTK